MMKACKGLFLTIINCLCLLEVNMFSKQFFDHWVPFKAILSNSDLSEMIQILIISTLVFSTDALRISQEKHKCLHECETRVVDLRRWEKLEAKFCRKN